jgi:SEC-C motif-containing protein
MKMVPCLCGSGQPIEACCGRYLDGQTPAPDAEALMRSRYTAYVLGNEPYLLTTWHLTTRPVALQLDEEPRPRWIGLTVNRHDTQDADHAIVEFVARYKINGRAFKLHETSRFVREDGYWFYVEGDTGE